MSTSSSAGKRLEPPDPRQALERWLEQGRALVDALREANPTPEAAANQGPPDFSPADLEAARKEVAALRLELESLEVAHFDLVCRNLGTLRLHSGHWLGEVLDTLVEVTLNFIGVGTFLVYLADESGSTFYPVVFEGQEEMPDTQLDPEVIARLGKTPGLEDDLLIPFGDEVGVLPLAAEDRLVGALRLVRFSPQKEELTPADHEFLTLLSEHGAIAIRRAWLTSTCTQTWWNATSLKALLD